MKDRLVISGRKENEIVKELLELFGDDESKLFEVLNDYEMSNGLYSLMENMKKYFKEIV